MVLEKIQKANDVKKLKPEELPVLAEEIRKFPVSYTHLTCIGHPHVNVFL